MCFVYFDVNVKGALLAVTFAFKAFQIEVNNRLLCYKYHCIIFP